MSSDEQLIQLPPYQYGVAASHLHPAVEVALPVPAAELPVGHAATQALLYQRGVVELHLHPAVEVVSPVPDVELPVGHAATQALLYQRGVVESHLHPVVEVASPVPVEELPVGQSNSQEPSLATLYEGAHELQTHLLLLHTGAEVQ